MRHAEDLLTWFDQHRRDLPWRRTSDPYKIWLSEVMLQQTRVETVLPFYTRFLERFPTRRGSGARPRSRKCWLSGPGSATTGGRASSTRRPGRSPRMAAFPSHRRGAAGAARHRRLHGGGGGEHRLRGRRAGDGRQRRAGPLALSRPGRGPASSSGARRQLLAAAAELLDPAPAGRQQPGPDGARGHPLLAAPPQVPPLPPAPRLPGGARRGPRALSRCPKVKREGERHRLLVAVVEERRRRAPLPPPRGQHPPRRHLGAAVGDPRARRRAGARRPGVRPGRALRRPLAAGPADRRGAARHHLPRSGGRRPPGGARLGWGSARGDGRRLVRRGRARRAAAVVAGGEGAGSAGASGSARPSAAAPARRSPSRRRG